MSSRREIKASSVEDDAASDDGEQGTEAEPEEKRGKRRKVGLRKQLKAWFRENRLWIYTGLFLLGIIAFVVGVASLWAKKALGTDMERWFDSIGNANGPLFLGALFLFLMGAYLYIGLAYKKADFRKLVTTNSKAEFLRNKDHLERLAFDLGKAEQEWLAERKAQFRIRR